MRPIARIVVPPILRALSSVARRQPAKLHVPQLMGGFLQRPSNSDCDADTICHYKRTKGVDRGAGSTPMRFLLGLGRAGRRPGVRQAAEFGWRLSVQRCGTTDARPRHPSWRVPSFDMDLVTLLASALAVEQLITRCGPQATASEIAGSHCAKSIQSRSAFEGVRRECKRAILPERARRMDRASALRLGYFIDAPGIIHRKTSSRRQK
ncbi:hypothetical protein ABIG04_009932 [Bradyrhizobium japonicum]